MCNLCRFYEGLGHSLCETRFLLCVVMWFDNLKGVNRDSKLHNLDGMHLDVVVMLMISMTVIIERY